MDNNDKIFDQFKEVFREAESKDFAAMETVWSRIDAKLETKAHKTENKLCWIPVFKTQCTTKFISKQTNCYSRFNTFGCESSHFGKKHSNCNGTTKSEH
jgi:hypothetical protein